jgi:hypothetical protein
MDLVKIIFSLTPQGFLVFVSGIVISFAALLFMRKEIPLEQNSVGQQTVINQKNNFISIDNWICSSPQIIKDSNGLAAQIEMVVLSNDFSWVYRSSTDVQRHGVLADIKNHLMSPGISDEIKKYSDIVAVGAASSEGTDVNAMEESKRAVYRADQIQLWIKEYISTSIPVYKLSLGYFKGDKIARDTSEQRKIVIIGVIKKDQEINFENALRISLPDVKAFPFNLKEYSEFSLKRSR